VHARECTRSLREVGQIRGETRAAFKDRLFSCNIPPALPLLSTPSPPLGLFFSPEREEEKKKMRSNYF